MGEELKKYVRTIPNFPKEGIMFRDVTTVLQDKEGLKVSVDAMQELIKDTDFNVIVAGDSRGFIFGAPIAYNLAKGFVPARKKGKLPYKTISASFTLEYGTQEFEMHVDAIKKGDKVVVIDDLLATGGTAKAMCELVEKLGGEVVKVAFLIELVDLPGRKLLEGYDVVSVIQYEGE